MSPVPAAVRKAHDRVLVATFQLALLVRGRAFLRAIRRVNAAARRLADLAR